MYANIALGLDPYAYSSYMARTWKHIEKLNTKQN